MKGIGGLAAGALCFVTHAAAATCPPPSDGVVDIYPTASVLPENLLRIYIYYPRPMAPDGGLRHVRLLDGTGAVFNGVFLSNRDELWSPDRRRLTLLLDPGRVKTGLDAHEAMGRALVAGQSYTLVVSGGALDSADCPLGQSTQYAFTVGPADFAPPDPAKWDFSIPRANSTDPLVIHLGSAHDHLSMAFRLRVFDAKGDLVPGAVALGDAEESWHFTPRESWLSAEYTLAVDERLEDLAGNRPGALFDRPVDQAPEPWTRKRVFEPAP